MKILLFRRLVTAFSWGVFSLPGLCPAQEITDVTITSDPNSQLKSLEITVDVPPLSIIQRQGNPLLSTAGWGDLTGDTNHFTGGETTFATPPWWASADFTASSSGASHSRQIQTGFRSPSRSAPESRCHSLLT